MTVDEIRNRGNARLGIHHWADRLVGRGVLIDAYGFRKAKGQPVKAMEKDAYPVEELEAALATDSPVVEPLPANFPEDEGLLHYRALPLPGLPLGELFVLAPLAQDCAADRRYDFMVVSTPLHVEGGIASPPNAVEIE